jgi:hypothetical protein
LTECSSQHFEFFTLQSNEAYMKEGTRELPPKTFLEQ